MGKISTLLKPYKISLDEDGKKTDLYIDCERKLPDLAYDFLDDYFDKDIYVHINYNSDKSIAQIWIEWVKKDKEKIMEVYDEIGFLYEFEYKNKHYTLKELILEFVK